MHDHFTVISTDGDRRNTRTVIAANERDAKQTHREHYPTFVVTTVVANGKRRSWRRLRTRPTGPAGIAASAAAPVFEVVDMGNACGDYGDYGDYDRWLTTLAEASARLDALQTGVTEIRHLCENGGISNEQILEVLDRRGV
jgi:hypothetical protein